MTISVPSVIFAGTATTDNGAVTLTAGAAVGDRVWFFSAMECGDTTPASPVMGITDSKSNSWTIFQTPLRNGTTGGTVMIVGGSTVLTTALVAGDTVTINDTNNDFGSTRRATIVAASSGVDTLDQQATYVGGSASSPTAGPTAATDTADEIVFGIWGLGVRTFTPTTGFTTLGTQATAAGTLDRQLSVEYKIVSATGAQSSNPTFSSASTCVGAVATFRAAAPTEVFTHFLWNGTTWDPARVTLL